MGIKAREQRFTRKKEPSIGKGEESESQASLGSRSSNFTAAANAPLCAPIAFDARAKLQADLFEGLCPTLSAVFAPCGITRESPCPCNPAVSLRSHSEYINVGREEDRGDR